MFFVISNCRLLFKNKWMQVDREASKTVSPSATAAFSNGTQNVIIILILTHFFSKKILIPVFGCTRTWSMSLNASFVGTSSMMLLRLLVATRFIAGNAFSLPLSLSACNLFILIMLAQTLHPTVAGKKEHMSRVQSTLRSKAAQLQRAHTATCGQHARPVPTPWLWLCGNDKRLLHAFSSLLQAIFLLWLVCKFIII